MVSNFPSPLVPSFVHSPMLHHSFNVSSTSPRSVHLLIPSNLHRHREGRHSTPVLPEVKGLAKLLVQFPRDLLQLTLRTRSSLDIAALEQAAEHCRQSDLAHLMAKVGVRAEEEDLVGVKRAGRVDVLGVGEGGG